MQIQKGRAALDHLWRSAARGKSWRHQLSIIRGRRRSSSLSDGVDNGELPHDDRLIARDNDRLRKNKIHIPTSNRCRESNGGLDERWLPTHITHSISSSHPQLESLSRRVMVSQKMQCNWALIMRRPASQLYVGIAAVDVANRRTRSAGCKRNNALVKVDRAVYGCADLNDQDRIRFSRRFD